MNEIIMISRILIVCISMIGASPLWAFNCYYTLVKDSCWTNYTVSVDVADALTMKSILSISIPPGQSWARLEFNCEPGQRLHYTAQFSPIFWEKDKGHVYPAKTFWSLPNEIKPMETAWNISVCYPANFAEVPFPPDAIGNCKCDFSSVPPLEPK